MLFFRIITIIIVLNFIAKPSVAQGADDKDTIFAVNACIKVVRNTKVEPGFSSFFKNFDAYYNPNTKLVYNNAQNVGDQKALFVFKKCMTEIGYPLGG